MKRDWPIIDQMDHHVCPEDSSGYLASGVQRLGNGHHGIEQGAGFLWRGSGAEIRAGALDSGCQRELWYQQEVAACLEEIQPHAAIILGKKAQRHTALYQPSRRIGIIVTLDAYENQQAHADGSHLLLAHHDAGRLHALDESYHRWQYSPDRHPRAGQVLPSWRACGKASRRDMLLPSKPRVFHPSSLWRSP